MDPINILVAINLFLTISANFSGAKTGLKTSITKVIERPDTYLQKWPPNISAIILLISILGVFGIGTFNASQMENYNVIRIVGLVLFVIFSWLQIFAYKSLGKNYAQDIVIKKEHELVTSGVFKVVRHPQYISQLLSDLGLGLALLSYVVTPLVIIVEIPLFIARALLEEKMLLKHFGDKYINYKKHSGFIVPFIG